MKRGAKRVNRAWLHEHLTDPYVRQAQREGYRSRAAYKLKEIDEAHGLIKPGQTVVDLGAAPGAWSQYLRRRLGSVTGAASGRVVALDLLEFEPIEGVSFLQGDFRDPAVVERLAHALDGHVVDLVVSDMAPNLSGIPASDSARMSDLIELALEFAMTHLRRPNGALLCKAFHGSGYSQLVKRFKDNFRTVKPIKPKASRDRSAETYLLGIGPRTLRLEAPSSGLN